MNQNQKDEEKLYKCSECSFSYKDKKWAEKCEAWCKEHRSCNLDIISSAVENNQKK